MGLICTVTLPALSTMTLLVNLCFGNLFWKVLSINTKIDLLINQRYPIQGTFQRCMMNSSCTFHHVFDLSTRVLGNFYPSKLKLRIPRNVLPHFIYSTVVKHKFLCILCINSRYIYIHFLNNHWILFHCKDIFLCKLPPPYSHSCYFRLFYRKWK